METFDLYIQCHNHFKFSGSDYSSQVITHTQGVTAVKAFNAVDSMGINPPCCEPELLAQAWNGKAALNLQIKMWAGGILDGISALFELQSDYEWLPDWVWESILGQTNGVSCKFDWYHKGNTK